MKKVLFLFMVFLFLLAACNMPSSTTEDEPGAEDLAMTYVAQTQAAQATEPPLDSTGTSTPTSTATATSSVPTVSVSAATNCRTGPDVLYQLVMVFQPGATAEVVGKYQAPNYWIIKTPTDDTCWLWGEYATIQGETSALPDMAAPPAPVAEVTPTATEDGGLVIVPGVLVLVPPAPTNFSGTASCQVLDLGGGNKILQGKMDKLSWSSVANATGYMIYVDGVEEQDLGGGATSTNLNALTLKPTNYGITAYNANGESTMKTIPEPACP